MHVTVERGALVRAVTVARATVPTRSTIPILGHVKIAARDGRIAITGTDLERQCLDSADCTIVTDGAITVPSDVFTQVAKALPAGDVSIRTGDADGRVELKSGRSRYRLATLPADDFPDITGDDPSITLALPAAIVCRLVADTLFAADTERLYMAGCFLHTPGNLSVIRSTATDGHRLMATETALPEGAVPIPAPGIILPRQAQSDIGKLLAGVDGDVTLRVSGTRLHLDCGSIRYTTKLSDGNYPDYQRVIPPVDRPHAATVSRDDLDGATRRILAVLDPRNTLMAVRFEDGELALSCRRGSDHDATDAITAEVDGPPIEFGISATYLIEQLAAMRGDRVTLACEAGGPIRMIDHGHETDVHVVMPMRL